MRDYRHSVHWWVYIGVFFLVGVQILLTASLLRQSAIRRGVEAKLRQLEEKFSKAFRQSPLALTVARMRDGCDIEVNQAFERETGWKREEVIGRSPLEIGLWVDPNERAEFLRILRTNGRVRDWEVKLRTKGDRIRSAVVSAELIDVDGEPCALSVITDITERKQMERSVRESEECFAGIVGSVMDAIIAIDEEQRIVLFNPAAEKMFGCTQSEALGSAVDQFIPPRFRREHQEHLRRFSESGGTIGAMGALGTLWALRRNGQEFPIEASVSQAESNGKKLFTAIIRDVTERKQAEEVLAGLSRKLIEVQEEEGRRIARDLHDDISQRLAVLAVEIAEFQQAPPASGEERDLRLTGLGQQIDEISSGLQSISRQLHSPQLEYLGIVPAIKSFCRDFAKRQAMEIDFAHDEIPNPLPIEISLCLFRVLQEALHNAAKHSKVRRFEVRLSFSGNQLHLTVSDHGAGFDAKMAMHNLGLGLISMRERVRLVHGTILIQSRPMAGTSVEVHVPFSSQSHSAQVAS